MSGLFGRELTDIEGVIIASAEEVIRCDAEKIGNFHKHIYRRLDIIVFPVGNSLLGDGKIVGKLDLSEIMRLSEFSDSDVEHKKTS